MLRPVFSPMSHHEKNKQKQFSSVQDMHNITIHYIGKTLGGKKYVHGSFVMHKFE